MRIGDRVTLNSFIGPAELVGMTGTVEAVKMGSYVILADGADAKKKIYVYAHLYQFDKIEDTKDS